MPRHHGKHRRVMSSDCLTIIGLVIILGGIVIGFVVWFFNHIPGVK